MRLCWECANLGIVGMVRRAITVVSCERTGPRHGPYVSLSESEHWSAGCPVGEMVVQCVKGMKLTCMNT